MGTGLGTDTPHRLKALDYISLHLRSVRGAALLLAGPDSAKFISTDGLTACSDITSEERGLGHDLRDSTSNHRSIGRGPL